MRKEKNIAIQLMLVALMNLLLCGCANSDNPNISLNNRIQTQIKTSCLCEFPMNKQADSYDFSKDAYNQKLSNQNVVVTLEEETENIELEFAPGIVTLPNSGLQVWSPSVLSLDNTISVKMPYTTPSDLMLKFSGDIDTGYIKCRIEGKIQKNNKKSDWLDENNMLTIEVSNALLNNISGWVSTEYWFDSVSWTHNNNSPWLVPAPYFMRNIAPMSDPTECGGLRCELKNENNEYIKEFGLSTDEIFNLIFNLNYLESEEYGIFRSISQANRKDKVSLNGILGGAFSLYPTGELIVGRNNYANYLEPGQDTNGIDVLGSLGISPMYVPSAIQYKPISETEIRLYLLPDQICHPVGFDWGASSYAGYSDMVEGLFAELNSDLPSGISLFKQPVIDLSNGDKQYKLMTTEYIGKKLVNSLLRILDKEENKTRFLDAALAAKPTINRETLSQAIDRLREDVKKAQGIEFGIELYKVHDVYNPFVK